MKRYIFSFLTIFAALSAPAQTVMTLGQCLDSALAYNRMLQNAALDIQSAREQQREAYTKYFPQVQANVLAFQAFDKIIRGNGTIPQEIAAVIPALASYAGKDVSVREFSRAYNITLSAMEPVYAGGRIRTANSLASIQKDVAELQYRLREKDLRQKITDNYWKIASLKYDLNTVAAAEKQVQEMYRQVELYVSNGITTRNDLLRVSLRQHELQSSRLRLENGQKVLLLLLAQQIGLAGKDIDIVADTAVVTPPNNVYAAPAIAVDNREELMMAQKGVLADSLQVLLERGKLLPSVAVGLVGYNTGLGGFSNTVGDILKKNLTNGMVAATVSIPISDWWGGTYAVRRRKLALRQAQNNLQDAREQLQVDIQSAWSDLQVAYKQIDIARASVQQAEENLRITSIQYKAGIEDLTTLLDAETLNRQARNSLSTALADYHAKFTTYMLKTR